MTDRPMLGCSLRGPELTDRVRQWANVFQRTTSREIVEGRIVASYPRDPHLIAELRSLIAAERDCCGFMTFEVHEAEDEVIVEVRVPEEMKSMLAAMFGQVTQKF